MDECKEIASFAARDFASAPQVIEFLRQVKMQLYKGVLPKLQESDNTNNTVLFNPTGCDVDENAICITDRIRNTGRNCTARYKRSGELATKTGRKSKKSKNSNALVVEKRCGVCKQAKTVCPVMICIRQHGLLMKKRNYALQLLTSKWLETKANHKMLVCWNTALFPKNYLGYVTKDYD